MIQTLRVISILSLLLAALVFVLTIFDYSRGASDAELTQTVSAVEQFTQTAKGQTQEDRERISPLVQQARALALYLNPPRVAEHFVAPESPATARTVEAKPASSSAKFELHGISYHRSRPAESMALVCEPGSGRRWVRQGAQLGHLVVEQINSTSIICRDGERTQEIALASGQALTQYAQSRPDKPAAKPLADSAHGKRSPPPVRGIRRMPASRVAAKIGLRLGAVDVAGGRVTETR